MKYHNTLIALSIALLIGLSTPVTAGPGEEAAQQAAEAEELQAQTEAEYREAMSLAEERQQAAEATIERNRERAQRASERAQRVEEESQRERAEREAELAEMQEELNRARRELQEASREVARVSREVARARARDHTGNRLVHLTTQKPVIGVILGDSSEAGIEVIGVSPDGPAERAGIEQGDFLVTMGGHDLGAGTEAENGDNLKAATSQLKAGEAIVVTYRRNDKLVDVNIVPEVREPLGWHAITRFPSAPGSPKDVIRIESIVVPELDTAELAERIANIKIEVEERAKMAAPRAPTAPEGYAFELHELSELGDTALWETNVWFGLPMTRGLKLAEIDPGLGEYFKTDRGVLVLKAREDNELQLESGDVILDVGDTEVNSPAEFMRALRELEPGEEIALEIKRDRKSKTLKTTMPERKLGFIFPGQDISRTLHFNYTTD